MRFCIDFLSRRALYLNPTVILLNMLGKRRRTGSDDGHPSEILRSHAFGQRDPRTPQFLFRAGVLEDETFSHDQTRYIYPQLVCKTFREIVRPGQPAEEIHVIQEKNMPSSISKIVESSEHMFSAWTPFLEVATREVLMMRYKRPGYCPYLAVLDTTFHEGPCIPASLLLTATEVKEQLPRDQYMVHRCVAEGKHCNIVLLSHLEARSDLYGKPSRIFSSVEFDLATGTRYAMRFGESFGEQFNFIVAAMAVGYLSTLPSAPEVWCSGEDELSQYNVSRFMQDYAKRPPRCIVFSPNATASRHAGVQRAMLLLYRMRKAQEGRPRQRIECKIMRGISASLLSTTLADGTDNSGLYTPSKTASNYSTQSDFSSAESPTLLPEGRLDESMKRIIQEARLRTPRYLFRGWRKSARGPSGGHQGLNTTEAVTPLAHYRKRASVHRSMYDFERVTLASMVHGHYHFSPHIETEFSSWAASLQLALHFASLCESPVDGYISIIDTKMLNNDIVYAPAFNEMLRKPMYSHEYFAHGVVSGPAYKAVCLAEFFKIGIPPTIHDVPIETGMRASAPGCKVYPLTLAEVRKAKRVGGKYGGQFVIPVAFAILSLKQRSQDLWRSSPIQGWDMIMQELGKCDFPQDLCGEATILTDIVNTKGYGDIEQLVRMLREMLNRRHGRGVRRQNIPARSAPVDIEIDNGQLAGAEDEDEEL